MKPTAEPYNKTVNGRGIGNIDTSKCMTNKDHMATRNITAVVHEQKINKLILPV